LWRLSERASRLKVWNTKPISLFRILANSLSFISLTLIPLNRYWPDVGVSRQPITFISVDFPDPDGPIMATYSFFAIVSVTPRSACTCSAPPISYVLTIDVNSITLMVDPSGDRFV
jgi:hypothetical protein